MLVVAVVLAALALLVAGLALRVAVAGVPWRRGDREQVPEDLPGLRREVGALRSGAGRAMRHSSVVRYDAFGDMGGHLSWSLSMLDDDGRGVVVTSISGRSEVRTYAKEVDGWTSDQQLSPEEEDAIAQARP